MLRIGNILLTALILAVPALRAQEGGDLQAQIEYAYQTEDDNTLLNVIQTLTAQVKDDAGSAALHYHLAHAQLRAGELARGRRGGAAAAAFSACIDELKPLIDKDARNAEALILQAACYAHLAEVKSLEAVLLRSRAGDRLKAALKAAPRNPRAAWITAMQELRQAKLGSRERQHGFDELQRAAQLFEQSSGTSPDEPGWGHAEAYLALGHELQLRGDHVGARNWIEKALLAAPDYKSAQRQMGGLTKP